MTTKLEVIRLYKFALIEKYNLGMDGNNIIIDIRKPGHIIREEINTDKGELAHPKYGQSFIPC